jgi:hypothetical protein
MHVVKNAAFSFYGEVFGAYLASDHQWYVPLYALCDALGIDTSGQRRRIKRDPAIANRLVSLSIETPYRGTSRVREVACLNLQALPYWLAIIDVGRVNEEHRPKIISFRRDLAEASWSFFRSDILPPELLRRNRRA